MSVESKIKQLLEGKTEDKKDLSEAEHAMKKPEELSSVSVGDVGQKTSQSMKKDSSKAGTAANAGDTTIQPNLGNSPKPTVDEFEEDEKNPGAKAAAKVIYAKNPSSVKMKGDAKTASIPGVTAKSGVSSMTSRRKGRRANIRNRHN
jgi:chromosomal replication initiation ATPase DnaA